MEMLLSFIAGLVLAGIAAIFVLRTEKKAAVAALEADLKNVPKITWSGLNQTQRNTRKSCSMPRIKHIRKRLRL